MASTSTTNFDRRASARSDSRRSRERRSFYLDRDVADSIDHAFRELSHELYPKQLTKSAFLETLIEYALEHREVLKGRLQRVACS